MSTPTQNLAVLIDADNASPANIADLLDEVAKYGTASVRRIYGDWTTDQLRGWKKQLPEHAIQPVQQFANTKGKNATDSTMIIDAMDLLYTGRFAGFCLVTSDSDFTRLATRIREDGLSVYGFGQKKTPKPFVAACDKFIYTEILGAKSDDTSAAGKRTAPAQLKSDTKLVRLLRDAVEAVASEEAGWAQLGGVGSHIQKSRPDFDSRNWGYAKLSGLLEAIGIFDVKRESNHVLIRDPQAK
ncbi:NYN domain-containing protein [Haloferula sargassicola]|uniref:HTH OST-type domain-containing protein n=1 Tax=Haloferula sargassicola TaxID=490096 RepID=A0ABP9UJ36_9BACT